MQSLDKRWFKRSDDGFLLWFKVKEFLFEIHEWDILCFKHFTEIIFELRVKEWKKLIIILLLWGVLGINGQPIIIFLLEVRFEHKVLNMLWVDHSLWIELNILLIFEYFILLNLNFKPIILLCPVVFDQFHNIHFIDIN